MLKHFKEKIKNVVHGKDCFKEKNADTENTKNTYVNL